MKKQAKKKVGKVSGKKRRNVTWCMNQALIQKAYIRLLARLRRCPTIVEVSDYLNISTRTIDSHVKAMKFDKIKTPLRALTPDVLVAVYKASKKGKSASQKLWFQVVEGWKEGVDLGLTANKKVDIHVKVE